MFEYTKFAAKGVLWRAGIVFGVSALLLWGLGEPPTKQELRLNDLIARQDADRAASAAREAAKPKIRHDIMYDRTEPFKVKVRLEPYSDVDKFVRDYTLQGTEFLRKPSTSGMLVTTETDELGNDKVDASGKVITTTRWKHISASMIIPPRVVEMLEADPAVHAVFDSLTQRENPLQQLSTEGLVDIEATSVSLD